VDLLSVDSRSSSAACATTWRTNRSTWTIPTASSGSTNTAPAARCTRTCPMVSIKQLGVFETSGRWLESLEDFRAALQQQRSLVADLGVLDSVAPLRDPAHGDFRLNPDSAAVDRGAAVFVPWALSGVAGEWNFCHAGGDPTQIIDEHWYAKDYLTDRTEYHARPTYPLTAVNVAAEDYIAGPLGDFTTAGALRFTASKKTYATVRNADLVRPFTARLATRAKHGQDPQPQEFTFAGDDLKSPAIDAGNFLIEAGQPRRPVCRRQTELFTTLGIA
jgi:hypothetical protein